MSKSFYSPGPSRDPGFSNNNASNNSNNTVDIQIEIAAK